MSDDELWHYCQGSDWTACGVEANAGINTVRQIADGVNCRDCLIARIDALTAENQRLREYLAKALRSICTTDSGDHWHVGTHEDCWICDAQELLEANDEH